MPEPAIGAVVLVRRGTAEAAIPLKDRGASVLGVTLAAVEVLANLEGNNPGRADFTIDTQNALGLMVAGRDDVLDPHVAIGAQTIAEWTPFRTMDPVAKRVVEVPMIRLDLVDLRGTVRRPL